MNYTLIIILIVLLFVIYQLKTKERFNVTDTSSLSTCPTGYTKSGGGTSSVCKKDIYTYRPRCQSGYGVDTVNNVQKCVKEEDNINLCPSGFELDYTQGICKNTRTLPSCLIGETISGDNCRKTTVKTEDTICPSSRIIAKTSSGTPIKDKCCPPDMPYYEYKDSMIPNEKGSTCRAIKLY